MKNLNPIILAILSGQMFCYSESEGQRQSPQLSSPSKIGVFPKWSSYSVTSGNNNFKKRQTKFQLWNTKENEERPEINRCFKNVGFCHYKPITV